MDVGEGVVVHGLFHVDGVQETDAVAELLQHFPALDEDTALWIGDYKGGRIGLGSTLHQVGLQPEACFLM